MPVLSKETLKAVIADFEKNVLDELWKKANAAYHEKLTAEMITKHMDGHTIPCFPDAIEAALAAVAHFTPHVPDDLFDVSEEKWKSPRGLAAIDNAYKYIKAYMVMQIKYLHAHITHGHEYFGYSTECEKFSRNNDIQVYLNACRFALQTM
jgi:hypothetical protein